MPAGEDVEVGPDLVPALRLLAGAASQWRRDAQGRTVGLDYPAVETVARWMEIDLSPDLFETLQTMEHAVLDRARRRREERS